MSQDNDPILKLIDECIEHFDATTKFDVVHSVELHSERVHARYCVTAWSFWGPGQYIVEVGFGPTLDEAFQKLNEALKWKRHPERSVDPAEFVIRARNTGLYLCSDGEGIHRKDFFEAVDHERVRFFMTKELAEQKIFSLDLHCSSYNSLCKKQNLEVVGLSRAK